jgi:hypothetical protein
VALEGESMSTLDDAYNAYLRQIFAQMMQNIASGEAMESALGKFNKTASLAKLVKSRAEATFDQLEIAESRDLAGTAPSVPNRSARRQTTEENQDSA